MPIAVCKNCHAKCLHTIQITVAAGVTACCDSLCSAGMEALFLQKQLYLIETADIITYTYVGRRGRVTILFIDSACKSYQQYRMIFQMKIICSSIARSITTDKHQPNLRQKPTSWAKVVMSLPILSCPVPVHVSLMKNVSIASTIRLIFIKFLG